MRVIARQDHLVRSRFSVWGLRFVIWGLGFGVLSLGFGVWGLGFGVWGLGFIFGIRASSVSAEANRMVCHGSTVD